MIFGERLNLWEWAGLSLTTSALLFLIGDRKGEEVASSPRERAQGVLAAMGAAACQAIAVLILRHSLQGVDVFTGTMLRIAPAILGLCLLNLWRGEWGQLSQVYQPLRNGLLVTGAAFMGTFIGLLLMSTGAKYAKAGVMTAISSTYPIWILPISYIVFRQKIPLRQIFLTILAVLGVVLMMTEQFF
jgi:drug/metabolite transporter (DMT)-like permease